MLQFQTSHQKTFGDSKCDSPRNNMNPSQNMKWTTHKTMCQKNKTLHKHKKNFVCLNLKPPKIF
jgi:hypothetical protein